MRFLAIASGAVLLSAACDPRQPQLTVTPPSVCDGGTVRVTWQAAEAETPVAISADQPTTPPLPIGGGFRAPSGSMDVVIGDHDTTFTASVPGGASVRQTVMVRSGSRTAPPLLFNGTCVDGAPPMYETHTITGSGRLLRLGTDADRPVQVVHGGAVIPVPAGGTIVLPPPLPPFAGDYHVIVFSPITAHCEGSSGMPRIVPPPIHLFLTGDCPNP